jgi:predicted RNA binding protein YcfA (HicA-like mRNA interferase family)
MGDHIVSPKLPLLKPQQLVRALKRAGFYEHHQTGSHLQMKSLNRPELRVTIPVHAREIKQLVLKSILKQADLTIDELRKHL